MTLSKTCPNGVSELQEAASTGQHAWLLQRIIALSGITTSSSVLDLGCGSGAWLRRLHEAGFSNLTGLDRSPGPHASRFGRIITGNFEDDDIGKSIANVRFQLVTLIEVIEHVSNPELLLKFAAERLAPHGWLIITTPNIYSLRARMRFLLTGRMTWFEEPANAEPDHIHPLMLEAYNRKIFKRLGLEIAVTCTYPEHGSDGTRGVQRLITRLLAAAIPDRLPGDSLCLMLHRG